MPRRQQHSQLQEARIQLLELWKDCIENPSQAPSPLPPAESCLVDLGIALCQQLRAAPKFKKDKEKKNLLKQDGISAVGQCCVVLQAQSRKGKHPSCSLMWFCVTDKEHSFSLPWLLVTGVVLGRKLSPLRGVNTQTALSPLCSIWKMGIPAWLRLV